MNLLFQTRKPRRFHHEPIYSDEREVRLRRLEQRARRELGEEPDRKDADTEYALNLKDNCRMRHRKQREIFTSVLSTVVMLFVLFILVLLLIL
jgi:hypothetical protein